MSRVRFETLPDGRQVEIIGGDGPRVSKRVLTPADDRHPEIREEAIVTETYAADSPELEQWRADLGREGERGLVDGAVSGSFPRRSRLAAAMAEADLDAAGLADAAMLPAALIEHLIETGDVPGDDHRRQLEAIVPDPFPESGELIEPTPNELSGDAVPVSRHRSQSDPAPTRGEAEATSQRRAAIAREVAEERERRRGAAQRADDARRQELDRGLARVLPAVRRLQDRLSRQ